MRGGPIFEFLFGLDAQLRREGRRDRIGLTFFNPMPNPGNRLGEKAVQRLLGEMKRRDIATHLGHKLVGFEKDKVKTEGGDFAADLIVFMPGLTGNAWFDATDLPRSPGGLITDKTFEVELLCIVDSLDAGMLVKRTLEGGFALPSIGLMHNAKAFFESWYLRRYR